MTQDLLAIELRNYPDAVKLRTKVKVLGGGKFEVPGSTGQTYRVELDGVDTGPRALFTVALKCDCLDHVMRGAVCKHAGACIMTLLPERQRSKVVEASRPADSASKKGSSMEAAVRPVCRDVRR